MSERTVSGEIRYWRLSFAHAKNWVHVADDERAVGFLADHLLHIDCFETQKLFGRQLHRFSIGIICRGSTQLCLFAVVFSQFLLLLGFLPLLFRRGLNALMVA